LKSKSLYSQKQFWEMKEISILDKTFEEYLSEENIQARIADMGRELNRAYAGKDPLIVSVLNGAFIFTADLVRHLNFDPEIQFVRLSSYHGGTQSSGQMRVLLDLSNSPEGRDVLIVEDIVDTGRTLDWLRRDLMLKGAQSVKIASLLFKHEMYQFDTPPEYYCFKIPNAFVVGYGLDYAERGRNLKAIYSLKA
jgi:hypoxanthine phosphoribosyltransferase